jgi:DNA polymerase-3 subunit delta
MVYVYVGEDMEVLKSQVRADAIEKVKTLDDFSFASFSMYNDLIQNAVEAAMNSSFVSNGKFVMVSDCYFLSQDMPSAPSTWEKQQDYQTLINYVQHQNPDTYLALLVTGRLKGEKSNPLIPLLKKHAKFFEIAALSPEELMEAGLRYIGERGGEIDRDSLYEIIRRTDEDYMMFLRTLDKLLCYTKKIRLEDVDELVAPKLEDNVFSIVESLFRGNALNALKSYRDLKKGGNDLLRLFSVFASQFRFLYETARLTEDRKNDIEISKTLSCSPMRIKYAKRSIGTLKSSTILKMMSDLGEMEEHVKFDLDDPDDAIELFIVNFRRSYLVSKA